MFFLLVGWLVVVAVGCCCFVFALAISIFTWNQSHRALGTQRQQLEQRTIASAPLGYRWNLTAVGCLRFICFIDWGVFRHLLCVFKAVGFQKHSSNNIEFTRRFFRSKKNMTATWRHHEKSPASHCFLRYRVATAMLGTSVVASLGWHGEIRIDFFPFGTSVKYFWANLRLYKLHLFQSFPLLRYRHHIALPNFNYVLERQESPQIYLRNSNEHPHSNNCKIC